MGSAVIDGSGKYRYYLSRWNESGFGSAVFIMVNPSTADALKDDPTIRRCVSFSKQWGCSLLCVVNLFAYRSKNPSDLKCIFDPVGPDNDRWILDTVTGARIVVAAWGALDRSHPRVLAVESWLRSGHIRELQCLGKTQNGSPRHPLYVPRDTKLVPWP